jgi:hypothetical protein
MPIERAGYSLHIRFSGLCAYVPRGTKEKRPERIDVLLPKSPPPESKERKKTNTGRDKTTNVALEDKESYQDASQIHLPILRFDLKNLPGNNLMSGDAKGFWLLNNEDIRLFHSNEDGSDPQPIKGSIRLNRGKRRKGSEKPDNAKPEQKVDISWLPEMKKALPEASDIDAQWLSTNPSRRIAARIHLEKGLLSSWKLSRYRGDYIVAKFIPAYTERRPYAQAIAHWVTMDVLVPRGRAVLVVASKFERTEKRRLVLKPVARGKKEIEIRVTNLCCGYALTEGHYGIELPAPDDDFKYLYRLCQGYNTDIGYKYVALPVPVPLKYRARRGSPESGGADPLRCTGVLFGISPLIKE